jgi:transposase-like protein
VNILADEEIALEGLLHHFSSDEVCAEALLAVKWPNGFICGQCGHRHAYKIATRKQPLFECASCGHQASLRAGTVMEGSRTSLSKWFRALLLVSLMPSGINAVQLRAAIGVTYKTAWLILHKLRHAMSQADTGTMLLSGIVRINAAQYGKPYNPSVIRHPKEQPLLVGASMTEMGEPIYVKIKQVPDKHLRERSVLPSGTRVFIERHVQADTADVQCITDRFGPRRFRRLLDIAKEANRWIYTMYQGIGRKHLQAYLDEFCFRMNGMFQDTGTSMFAHLSRLCATTPALTYSSLTRHCPNDIWNSYDSI